MNFLVQQRVRLTIFCSVMLLALSSTPPVQAQTLDRVKESGVIRLGFRADARPFSYRDASGKAAGYSMALCQQVAKAVKAELGLSELVVEEKMVTSADRFRALEDRRIDVLCGAATITLSRRENMSFSMPIFLSGMSAMLRADAPADLKTVVAGEDPEFRPLWRASYAEILKQRIIAVIRSTTAEKWLDDHIKDFNIPAHVVPYADYDGATENLLSGRADVFFGDRAVLLDIAATKGGELTVLDRQYTYEAISFAILRGDDAFQLLIDKTLSRLYRSGEINGIYTQYFGEPDETAQSLFTRAALPE